MNIYNQSFANPEFLRAVRIIQMKALEIKSLDDHLRAYDYMNPNPEDPEYLEASSYVTSWYEGLGVFIKEGLIDIRLIALTMTGMTRSIWGSIAPYLEEIREISGFSRMLSEFEYLVNELEAYLEEHPELDTTIERGLEYKALKTETA